MFRAAPLTLAGCLALSVCLPVSAQTLLVRVTEAESGRPILGTFVTLRNDQGSEVRSALTNTEGRILFVLPAAGGYSVRAQMVGRQTEVTPLIPVATAEAVVQDLRMAVRAIELEGIAVEGSRRCRLHPSEGEETAVVWEEARKALEVVAWALKEAVFWYQIEQRTREYGPDGRRVIQQSHRLVSGYFREPFRSLPAADLVEGGFLRAVERDTLAYAPDAAVLLSDPFLDSHCFRIEKGDDPDLVGLAFEPVDKRSPADIEGVLWLSQRGSRLRSLDFRYTGSFAESLKGESGGSVEFEYLPSGAWIVRRWHIRAPIRGEVERGLGRARVWETTRIGYTEEGGEVLRVRSREGEEITAADRALLTGTVYDSTLSRPLRDARVFLVGTDWEARTDQEGRFRMPDLPGGSYTVEVTHPSLDSLGLALPPTEVELEPGRATRVDLAVPKHPRTVALGVVPESARLTGRVVAWETGEPLAGVEIALAESGAATLSDAEGRFGFPALAPGSHAVRARYLGRGTVEDTVTLEPGESLQIELRLPVEPISVEGILVEVERRALWLESVGFFERRTREHGVFITQEQIEERKPVATVDLFEGVPGVRVVRARDGIRRQVSLVGSRAVSLTSDPFTNPCFPTVWIDGQPYVSSSDTIAAPIYIDDLVDPMAIAAIEIYQTTARIPVQYNLQGACGVIVIWTRRE